ncbi:MAG: bifunctional phosphopantothenoylcysteine decarboxylase/phosphopantothenate--cysteine ligase CoaBC [bacterium]
MGKNLVLGISGGIAACKAPLLVRDLQRRGVAVRAVVTENAKQFVTETSLRTLTGSVVYDGLFTSPTEHFEHISLADWGDVLLVAPATANVIGKFASGVADDLLSTLFAAFHKTVLIAPAMNENMYLNPAVQKNLETLKKRGVIVLDPRPGMLACGAEGVGRMMEPVDVAEEAARLFDRLKRLKGKRVLVTASATREHIDPVRFISNPSSGKMGFALAEAFLRHGCGVTLVSGPTALIPHSAMRFHPVVSAGEMFEVVKRLAPRMDVIVKSAAVADYAPASTSARKIKKTAGELTLKLKRTEDILEHLGRHKRKGQVLIGFAAETEKHLENAAAKLGAKNLDMIVVNDVGAAGSGFGADDNRATLIAPDRGDERTPLSAAAKRRTIRGTKVIAEELPLMSKRLLAARIVEAAAAMVPR